MPYNYGESPVIVDEVEINGAGYNLMRVPDIRGGYFPAVLPIEFDLGPLGESLSHREPHQKMGDFVADLRRMGPGLVAAGLPDAFNGMYHHVSRGAFWTVLNTYAMRGQVYYSDEYPDLQEFAKNLEDYPTFDMPEKVERVAGGFGKYYRDPVYWIGEAMDTGDLNVLMRAKQSWLMSLLHPVVHESGMDGPQAMAGMTAHIDDDLEEAQVDAGVTWEYFSDFIHKMPFIFAKTRMDLGPVLVPGSFPSGAKRLIAAPAMGYIAGRRAVSWDRAFELDTLNTPAEGEIVLPGERPQAYRRKMAEFSVDACRRIDAVLAVGGTMARMAMISHGRLPKKRTDWRSKVLAP